ncbi:MAG: hypothetical protein OEW75_13380 [Cyclobacteriaceae bacterium]|nr:hypothetical protein [Cyclobacteriaceae bacterium]
MKKFIFIVAIFFAISLQSCLNDDCGECFSPPTPFYFQFVDKISGENLFTNGTLSSDDIVVLNTADGSPVQYSFVDENDFDLLKINTIGWETETVNYSIRVSADYLFNLGVDTERVTSGCCTYTIYNDVTIDTFEFEFDQVYGVYRIFIV